MKTVPKYIWFGMRLGYVYSHREDGSLQAYFHDDIGGPGYVIWLQPEEWKAA
jgi:hypothetical protein